VKTGLVLCLALLLLLAGSRSAQAAISCSISSPGVAGSYSGALSVIQSSFTLDCSRLSSDPTTSAYNVRPDNGLNSGGQQNRVVLSTFQLDYEEYQDSGCSSSWIPSGPARNAISGTVNFGTALNVQVVRDFWACIPASQSYAAGVYTDTVTMTLTYNTGSGNTTTTGSQAVMITGPASCSFSTAPGTINFNYTAWQAAVATANTTFGTTCTILASYTISVTEGGGVVSGLNYLLQLNTSGSGGTNPLGSTGTGVQQLFYINATMPADQAGYCPTGTCIDSNTHTITLTF
jgi:spore coat protein U-like protein